MHFAVVSGTKELSLSFLPRRYRMSSNLSIEDLIDEALKIFYFISNSNCSEHAFALCTQIPPSSNGFSVKPINKFAFQDEADNAMEVVICIVDWKVHTNEKYNLDRCSVNRKYS
jgi:hypothetical protein